MQADIEGGRVKQDHANKFQIAYPLFGAWGLAVAHSKARVSMSRCKTNTVLGV